MMNKLIGVSGFARTGKDTFYKRCASFLSFHGFKSKKYSFAHALKSEIDPLLSEHVGISAFTEKDIEKEIIRPLLVTYGTDIRRKLNPNCWIESIQDKVQSDLSSGHYVFISDVRFLNEAEWIKNMGGYLFNIQRDGIKAANKDESEQYFLFKNLIDYTIRWPTLKESSLSELDDYIVKLFDEPSPETCLFPKKCLFIDSKPKKNFQTNVVI